MAHGHAMRPARPLHEASALQPLLSPRSVAIVGASARPGSFGYQTLRNLDRGGVTTLLVHPKGEPIEGRTTYRSVGELPAVPDCAVIAVARDAVLDVARACAAKGIRGAVVYASGFAETGRPQDVALQQALRDLARDTGMRILGPNTMGLMSDQGRVRLTFFGDAPELGQLLAILETCAFLAKAGRPSSTGVAGLATSGGAAIMIADKAEQFGVGLPQPRAGRPHPRCFGAAHG